MHFAFPPRKTSHPPPYAARSSPRSHLFRRFSRLKPLAVIALSALAFFWLVLRFLRGGSGRVYVPPDTPKAVVVTVFDTTMDSSYKQAIMDNREDYASRHGYTTFFANTSSYNLGPAKTPTSWSILPALRHAMTLYPHTPYLFHLAPTALIMAPTLNLEAHIMSPQRLESLMEVDKPVVPPDSVIKTFSHIKGENVDLVLTQDSKGLSQSSMVIRTGDWARFFLEAWFDPLYRSYNFQKAERHALEHIVQWHGTILVRLALVPQRTMNSYVEGPTTGVYKEGDFVANFADCANRPVRDPDDDEQQDEDKDEDGLAGKSASKTKKKKKDGKKVVRTTNTCEVEMRPLLGRWREMVDREGRGRGKKVVPGPRGDGGV